MSRTNNNNNSKSSNSKLTDNQAQPMIDQENAPEAPKLDKDSQDNKIDKSMLREKDTPYESDDDDEFYEALDTPFDTQQNNIAQTNKSDGVNNTPDDSLRKHTVKERVAQIEMGSSTAQVDITKNSTLKEVDRVTTRGNVPQNIKTYEQLNSSSNTDTHNRTAKNNQRLYNAAMPAEQDKRKRSYDAIDDTVPSDGIAKKIRTSASYNSSLQNNIAQTSKLEIAQQLPTSHNVNSIVQGSNTPPEPPKSQQLQGSQLYNNAQQGNSVTSTSAMPKSHVDNSSVYTSPTSQSSTSQPSSQLKSPSKAEDKIALGSTNHNGVLQAFQALQQLLHEILSADEKYQEWQQQNPDKTPHDFQQDSKLVKSISNETRKLLEEISLSGTANIVGSGKNTQYAQANSFANKLQDLNWHNSDESTNQTVNNTFPGMVNTAQKVNMSFDVNGNTQHVSKVRRVTIPTSLGKEDEAASVALVLLDKNGNRPPESKALYFTAHYSTNESGESKLTDITYPKPLHFCSDAPDSPCYVLQGNKAYFLPINRQDLQNLLKEIDLNKGIEREPVAQDKIITNSPPAQDKIITNSLQPKNQHNRNLQNTTTPDDASDIVKVTSANNGMRQGNNITSQSNTISDIIEKINSAKNSIQQSKNSTSQSNTTSNILQNINIDDITTNLQNSKAPTPRNMHRRSAKKKPTRTPGR